MLEGHIELHPVEISGRGLRYDEQYNTDFPEMLNDLADQVKQYADKVPYAIFGHSMGAVLAYELYYRLVEEGYPAPVHLFISGRPAPNTIAGRKSLLSKMFGQLQHNIFRKNGGIPDEIAKRPELAKKFREVLQSDIRLMDTYSYKPKQDKIRCPVTIFSGMQDQISKDEIQAWESHTINTCNMIWMNGDHFFLETSRGELISIINSTIPVLSSR